MELELKNQLSPEAIREFLQGEFTDHKVKSPWLSSRVVLVQKGAWMVSVRINGRKLKIKGGLNSQGIGFIIAIILGFLFGWIIMLIIFGLVSLAFRQRMKDMEKKVVQKFLEMEDDDGTVPDLFDDDTNTLDSHLI